MLKLNGDIVMNIIDKLVALLEEEKMGNLAS